MKDQQLIAHIRSASRILIRELGFMESTIADTGLSPSAVHAIIEIGEARNLSGRDLAEILMLEKSTVSRLTKNLLANEMIEVQNEPNDARFKLFRLTAKGKSTLLKINSFAENQVLSAIGDLKDSSRVLILEGIRQYADALRMASGKKVLFNNNKDIHIKPGYVSGVLARIVEMHMNYFSTFAGFGLEFEAGLSSGIGEFATRLNNPQNSLWSVHYMYCVMGSIAIDGDDIGNGIAHLRWFIVEDALRGTGIGKILINKALAFSDKNGFKEIHLWTFKGLNAARSLYEANGFTLEEERPGLQWGKEVMEQRFIRKAA